jgi:hypothetical protein
LFLSHFARPPSKILSEIGELRRNVEADIVACQKALGGR